MNTKRKYVRRAPEMVTVRMEKELAKSLLNDLKNLRYWCSGFKSARTGSGAFPGSLAINDPPTGNLNMLQTILARALDGS